MTPRSSRTSAGRFTDDGRAGHPPRTPPARRGRPHGGGSTRRRARHDVRCPGCSARRAARAHVPGPLPRNRCTRAAPAGGHATPGPIETAGGAPLRAPRTGGIGRHVATARRSHEGRGMPGDEQQKASGSGAWEEFAGRHDGNPHLAADPLYVLARGPDRHPGRGGLPRFFNEGEVAFERDWAKATRGGLLFRRRVVPCLLLEEVGRRAGGGAAMTRSATCRSST